MQDARCELYQFIKDCLEKITEIPTGTENSADTLA